MWTNAPGLSPQTWATMSVEERVGGDVEGDAQKEIGAPLVELAAQDAVGHEEVKENVARREGHPADLRRVPGRDDVAAAVRVVTDVVDDAGDLVDGAADRGSPIPPLRAVHAAEVAVGVRPFVPDGDTVLIQIADVRFAAQKPEQLVDDGFEMQLLGCQQREAFREVEPRLRAEPGVGADAGCGRP